MSSSNVFMETDHPIWLRGKRVLITGASSGIGCETARLLAPFCSELYLVARRHERIKVLASDLEHPHCRVVPISCDLTEKDAIRRKLGPLTNQVDVLVNNAGAALGQDQITDARDSDWDTMLDLNLRAASRVIKAFVPGMIERNQGYIINLTSVASHRSYAGGSMYCATKHALLAFSRSLRSETCDHNIRVTNISPGMTETEFSLVRFSGDQQAADRVYAGMKPLTGRDVARQILFCLMQEEHVNIDEIYLTPRAQGELGKVSRD